jgi:hypothetical protein
MSVPTAVALAHPRLWPRRNSLTPANEFEKAAWVADGSPVLVQQGKLPVLEGGEEFVSIDGFQLVIRFGKIDAEDSFAVLSLRPLHLGRLTAALFDPPPYRVVNCSDSNRSTSWKSRSTNWCIGSGNRRHRIAAKMRSANSQREASSRDRSAPAPEPSRRVSH